MAAAIQWLDRLIEDNADPRTANWPLMQSPIPGTTMVFIYLLVVWIGPKIMRDRAPYSLKQVLLIFNLFMVILSFYTCWEFLMGGWMTGYTLGCQLVDYSTSPKAMRMANICWVFYVSKFIEMLDTVFFILRKKNNQISFLHVFHHALMPFTWWIGVKFVPGGFGTFHALLNSFIHFMMYIYYFLAALGPAFQKFLWWKKYMTTMQLTQFALCMIHSGQLLFTDCSYPKFFAIVIWSYGLIFFVMFMDFYVKTYKKKSALRSAEQNGVSKSKGQ